MVTINASDQQQPHTPSGNEQSSLEPSISRRSSPNKKASNKVARVLLGRRLPPLTPTSRHRNSKLLSEIKEAAGSVPSFDDDDDDTDAWVPSQSSSSGSSRATLPIYDSKVSNLPPMTRRHRKSKLLSEIQEAAGFVPRFDDDATNEGVVPSTRSRVSDLPPMTRRHRKSKLLSEIQEAGGYVPSFDDDDDTDGCVLASIRSRSRATPIFDSRVSKGGGAGSRRRSDALPTPKKDSTTTSTSTRALVRGTSSSERRRKWLPDATTNKRPSSERFQREDLMEEISPRRSERRLDKNNFD